MRSADRNEQTRRTPVAIFDTTLRDGEQSAGVCFSLGDKVEIAAQLDALRVDVIEAGFPGASPAELEAVRWVAAEVKNASVCALARAKIRDVDAAWSAVQHARAPRLHVFLSSSEVHLGHQLRKSREQVKEMAAACVARARHYTPDVEFSPMDATRSEPEFLATLVRAALAAGARTINIPDTVGCAHPDQVGTLLRELQTRVPELEDVVVSFHGQNDLGLATANALAAVQAGARQVEVTVNGIGERAGNTSLEEFVMALRMHGQALGACTRVDTTGIYALSQLVEERSGLAVSANKAIVGRNAFRHASGIHQDGVLKRRETYECLDPREIGHPVGSEIVLGKLSGRHGFAARVKALGIQLNGHRLDEAFARFQRVADKRREVQDLDLRVICGNGETWPGPGI